MCRTCGTPVIRASADSYKQNISRDALLDVTVGYQTKAERFTECGLKTDYCSYKHLMNIDELAFQKCCQLANVSSEDCE